MKRLIALLLALLLTACSASPPAQEEAIQPAPAPTPPPPPSIEEEVEQPAPPQKQVIRYEADTVMHGETVTAEDGTPLVSYAVDVPALTAWREDGTEITEAQTPQEEQALAAVQTFNERFAVWYADEAIDESAKAAAADLAWHREEQMEWYGGYSMELSSTIYQTENFVSIAGAYCAYTGGAHPNTYLLGWTFDLAAGQFFGAESLAGYPELQEAVAAEIIRQAQERAAEYEMQAEEMFWPEYEEIIADWPSYAVSLNESGMTVAFSPYELAAYAAGVQEFHIPYDVLAEHLDEHAKLVLDLTTE